MVAIGQSSDRTGQACAVSKTASIRVGFFEDFKGEDTLLIDVDRDGLRNLAAWLRDRTSSGQKVSLDACPGARLQSGLLIDLVSLPGDVGLVRTDGTEFVWQRAEEG
jgi:hypothetical protein